jgi:hypothetical protein
MSSMLFIWIGYAIGFVGVANEQPLVITILAVWVLMKHPSLRIALIFGYFLGATNGIPEAIRIYNETTYTAGVIGYLLQAIFLTIPFALFSRFTWGIAAGSILLLVSPIGWTNPLIIAGYLFPDAGTTGAIAVILALVWHRNIFLLGSLAFASIIMNLNYIEPIIGDDVVSINTSYSAPIHQTLNFVERSELAIISAEGLPDSKIILPETHFIQGPSFERVVPYLEQISETESITIIAGLYSVKNNENVLVVFKKGATYLLPIQANAMVPDPKNPLLNIGPSWHLLAPPAQDDGDLLIVCFEEYHMGLFLWKMTHANAVKRVIGFENLWWSNGQRNSMVKVQRMYARLSARLFGLPYTFVYNN